MHCTQGGGHRQAAAFLRAITCDVGKFIATHDRWGAEQAYAERADRPLRPCSLPLLKPGILSILCLLCCFVRCSLEDLNIAQWPGNFTVSNSYPFSCSSGPQFSRASLFLQASSLQNVLRYESRQLQHQAWVTLLWRFLQLFAPADTDWGFSGCAQEGKLNQKLTKCVFKKCHES